jgi:hypothetical protein
MCLQAASAEAKEIDRVLSGYSLTSRSGNIFCVPTKNLELPEGTVSHLLRI